MGVITKAIRTAANKLNGITRAEQMGLTAKEEADMLNSMPAKLRGKTIKDSIHASARETGDSMPKVTEEEMRATGASIPTRAATIGERTIPRPDSSFKSGGKVKAKAGGKSKVRGCGIAQRGHTRAK